MFTCVRRFSYRPADPRRRARASRGRQLRRGRCWAAAVHWCSLGPARGSTDALVSLVLLRGSRGTIRAHQWGREEGRSVDIAVDHGRLATSLPGGSLDLAAHTAHTVPILYGHETASLVGRIGRTAQVLRAGVGAIDADWPGASIGDGADCSQLLRGTGRETLFCCPYYPYKLKKVTQLNASRNEPSQNVRTVRAVWADWCHSTPSLTRNSSHRSTVSGDGRNRRGSA